MTRLFPALGALMLSPGVALAHGGHVAPGGLTLAHGAAHAAALLLAGGALVLGAVLLILARRAPVQDPRAGARARLGGRLVAGGAAALLILGGAA